MDFFLAALLASSVSTSSPDAVTRASQSCALISEVLDPSKLNTASYPLSTAKFARYLREQRIAPSLPLKCVETYKDTSPASAVGQATQGVLGHQFIIITILLPRARETHVKVDYWAMPPSGSDSQLVVRLSDDHYSLTHRCTRISCISAPLPSPAPSTGAAPTLATLAELLIVAHGRLAVRQYHILGYNCMWMTDMLFYTLALRHAEHWLTGSQTPEAPIKRYLRSKTGAFDTAVACLAPDEATQWWVALAGKAVRAVEVAVTHGCGEGRYMMHDTEVFSWVGELNGRLEKAGRCGA